MIKESQLTPMDVMALSEHASLVSQYNSAPGEQEEELSRQLAKSYTFMSGLDIPEDLIATAEFLGTPEDERQKLYNIWSEDGIDDDVLSRLRYRFGLQE
jgi:hypothetical protein